MIRASDVGVATIVRYTANERTNHWIVAIAFVLTALSGLALFHPALFWLANLFGGGPWTRILHPIIGLLMTLAFLFLAAAVWKDNRLQESRTGNGCGRCRTSSTIAKSGCRKSGATTPGRSCCSS